MSPMLSHTCRSIALQLRPYLQPAAPNDHVSSKGALNYRTAQRAIPSSEARFVAIVDQIKPDSYLLYINTQLVCDFELFKDLAEIPYQAPREVAVDCDREFNANLQVGTRPELWHKLCP